jgi:hypothetical protein
VVRRLFSSLVVLACLLGVLEPSIACAAACNTSSDCCPIGSPANGSPQLHQPALAVQAIGCCEANPAPSISVAAIDARSDQGHACGPSAATAPSILIRVERPPQELTAAAAQIPARFDESETYLSTARLRL